MRLEIHLDEDRLKPIIEKIGREVFDSLIKDLIQPLIEQQSGKNYPKKFISITECAREYNLSRPTIHSLLKSGILPSYQIPGSPKKYLKPEEVEQAFIQVQIPPKVESYQSFEEELRKAFQRGRKLQQLIEEFKQTDNKQTLSNLSLWLWEQGCSKSHLIGALLPELLTQKYSI